MNSIFSFSKFFFGIFLCGLFAGCPGPLNVPTAWVDSFTRNGATTSEVRAALLECGASVPGYESEYLTPEGRRFPPAFKEAEHIFIGKCMRNSGYPYNDDRACAGGTDMNGKSVIPAPCRPDAVVLIPKRSIENRLNSPYCKTYPKTKICQRDYDPSKDGLSPPVNPKPSQKSISIAPSIDPAIKLQNQVQKNSNAQMNQLLQGAGGRK
nr:hypothetical protein [uncultured Limnohabitans sp.]